MQSDKPCLLAAFRIRHLDWCSYMRQCIIRVAPLNHMSLLTVWTSFENGQYERNHGDSITRERLSALLALCEGSSPTTRGFLHIGRVMRIFDVSFYVDVNKLLGNRSICTWFETPWRSCVSHWEIYFIFRTRMTSKFIIRRNILIVWHYMLPPFTDIKHDNKVTSHERHGVSNQRQLDCFNSLFRLTTEKTSNLRISVHLESTDDSWISLT